MFENPERAQSGNYFLKPGFILVPKDPTIISTVLGSCVAVCVFDRKRRCGAMNHFQLPFIDKAEAATARYGNVATLALIAMMVDSGSRIKDMEAQLFGGACNPRLGSRNIGAENVRVARMVLTRKRIRIVSEDVGGERGRKIVFDSGTNQIAVMKVEKIRQGDWFPYAPGR